MGRSETLFGKIKAIEGLCAARVALIVFGRDGVMRTWPEEAEAVRATIEAYRMCMAKGKKRMREAVNSRSIGSPSLPSVVDVSLLNTAMGQKLQAIELRIQTLTAATMFSTSSPTLSSPSLSDWFSAASLPGLDSLDIMDYDASDPPFYVVAALPPPQESPTATSSSSRSNAASVVGGLHVPIGSESEIIAIDDSEDEPIAYANAPIILIDDDDENEDEVRVEEEGHLDSCEGLLDFTTTPSTNLEDYNFVPSSPGTYTDFALMANELMLPFSFCSEERLPAIPAAECLIFR